MTDNQINLKDVRIGDTIETRWNLQGVTITLRGVVSQFDSTGDALTAENGELTWLNEAITLGDDSKDISLIHRPAKTWQEELADAGHTPEDRWVGLNNGLTYRVKDGNVEYYHPHTKNWYVNNMKTDSFLMTLETEPESWAKVAL